MEVKILFLDIDGVLNKQDVVSMYDDKAILSEKITLINQIVEKTKCVIVVISNWATILSFQRLCERLYEKGLIEETIFTAIGHDETPTVTDEQPVSVIKKDFFIKTFIEEHKIKSYVVIDDSLESNDIDKNHIVIPKSNQGIVEGDVFKAIDILNAKHHE